MLSNGSFRAWINRRVKTDFVFFEKTFNISTSKLASFVGDEVKQSSLFMFENVLERLADGR